MVNKEKMEKKRYLVPAELADVKEIQEGIDWTSPIIVDS